MISPATTDLIAACVPSSGRVVLVDGEPALAEALEHRAESVERSSPADVAGDAAAIVLGAPLDHLADPAVVLKELAASLTPSGRLVAVVPTTSHAALKLGLETDPRPPEALARAAAVAWPATIGLLESAGLHRWWEVPVTAPLLAGSGVDDDAISPEVLEVVGDEPSARVAAVIVVAGVGPVPPQDHALLASMSAELAELRSTAADLHQKLAERSRDADRATHAAAEAAELRAEVVRLRLELDASLAGAGAGSEYAAQLESQLDDADARLSRGFTRIGSRLDDRMLHDERLGRLHAAGGRLLRALRRR